MELYIIRHAESANNALWYAAGPEGYNTRRLPDPPLTELGHAQAKLLARHLVARPDGAQSVSSRGHNRGGFGLTHLYTSLMRRAIVTAAYVAEATGLPLLAWPDVHERGGLYEQLETGEELPVAGPGRAAFAAEHPYLVLPETLAEAGWWGRGRETEAEYMPRAQRVWRELLQRHGDTEDRVAIVTHGGFFQSLMSAITTIAPEAGIGALWFGISNASISRFDVMDGMVGVRYLNSVGHLPDELLTG